MAENERQGRNLKEHWHRVDEDKYRYKSFRKGNEPVETWWMDPFPEAPNYRSEDYDYQEFLNEDWRRRHGHFENWWNYRTEKVIKSPYPEKDDFYKGEREGTWRKERGYWENGRWLPTGVQENLKEKLGKYMQELKGSQRKYQMDIRMELNGMKKNGYDRDRERAKILQEIEDQKAKMNAAGPQAGEVKHNYAFETLTKTMVQRPGVLEKRTDVIDNVNTFPKLDKMLFKMQGRPNGYRTPPFNDKLIKFTKEKDGPGKINTFDADYLNQVNQKRNVDLDYLNKKSDVVDGYLDRETKQGIIEMHEFQDVRNEVMNRDILKNHHKIQPTNYETPLEVVNKFSHMPSVKDVANWRDRL